MNMTTPAAQALPDFDVLRAERNAATDAFAKQMQAKGWEVSSLCSLHHKNACYCACPEGPCEHKWDGKPYESDDGCEWSTTCSRCGTTSMSHSMRSGM